VIHFNIIVGVFADLSCSVAFGLAGLLTLVDIVKCYQHPLWLSNACSNLTRFICAIPNFQYSKRRWRFIHLKAIGHEAVIRREKKTLLRCHKHKDGMREIIFSVLTIQKSLN